MQLKQAYWKILSIVFIFIFTSAPAAASGKLTFDFSERHRVINWDNPITLDSSSEGGTTFTRHRTSLGLNWKISKKAEFYFKATNEFRIYFDPKRDFNIHEIFIDNLYLKLKNLFSLPITLTLGRQNIFLGEGFIILDGGPYDGSRSAYFDALRADVNLKKTGQITLFVLSAQQKDDFLPMINDRDQLLNDNDIRGTGIYYRKEMNRSTLDLYFLNKQSDVNRNKSWTHKMNTTGFRIHSKIIKGLELTTEAAYQYGSTQGADTTAWGGYFHLDKGLGNGFFTKFTLGGIWLSGNECCDIPMSGWDPPFSRWPKWSESYIYTLINEGGVAYWSNLNSIYVSLITTPFKKGLLQTTLHLLGAPDKSNPFLLQPFPGGGGNGRGTLFMNKLNIKFSNKLSAHILWEHFKPGDYYFTYADNYNWFRLELMYRTKFRR